MHPFDQVAKENGFESAKEFMALVSSRDISTPAKMAAFRLWQYSDHPTKEALLKLPARPESA